VFPAASAGPTFQVVSMSGAFGRDDRGDARGLVAHVFDLPTRSLFSSRSAKSAKNSMLCAARGTTRVRLPISREPLSVVSTAASSFARARMRSANAFRIGWRPRGPSAAQAGNASRAASTAASISGPPPAATSASGAPSIGHSSRYVLRDATRCPPIQCSVETSTPRRRRLHSGFS
jgi:hypothetical protein